MCSHGRGTDRFIDAESITHVDTTAAEELDRLLDEVDGCVSDAVG